MNEDIRKKEKKLDCNHWMCKIQLYTFGIDAPNFYMGYCPFFWMTWLALICLPFVFVAKLLYIVSLKPLADFSDKMETSKYEKLKAKLNTPLEPPAHVIVECFKKYKNNAQLFDGLFNYLYYNYGSDEISRYAAWFKANTNWKKTHYPIAKKRMAELDEVRKKAMEKHQKREAFKRKAINTISKYAAIVVKCLIPVVVAAILFVVYKMYAFCAMHILGFLQAAIIILCIAIFVVCIKILWNVLDQFVTADHITKADRVICGFFGGIGGIFKFIGETVKMTYKRECPLIIWGEETGKIVKRKKD
jgi:hypothetical protein